MTGRCRTRRKAAAPARAAARLCVTGLGGLLVAAAGGVPGLAQAQGRSLALTPSFSATQQFTDNRDLSATDRQADSITTFSPGLRLSSGGGRIRGTLDYSLNGTVYAQRSEANNISQALSAGLNAELYERHAFLDARASISQQSISALNLQGTSRPNTINPNSTELRSLSLTPSVRGRPFDLADFNASVTSTLSQSADNISSDTATHTYLVRLGDGGAGLGWSLDGSRSISDFDRGRRTTQDRVTAQLNYRFSSGLNAFARAGRERDNVQSADFKPRDTWGAGFTWQPTPRTSVSAQADRRFFGDSHSVSVSHRMRRSVFSYSDSRSSTENTAGAGATFSVYEQYFQQFESLERDPVLRDILVRAFLQAAGLDPNQRLSGGFLSSAVSLQRSQNLSYALQGLRNNFVLSAFATSTRRLDRFSNAQDDLSDVDVLRQRGFSASLSHRMTPTSSMVLSLSQQKTVGTTDLLDNDLNAASLAWTTRLGRSADFSASLRHSKAGGTNPYTESALLGTFSMRF